MNKLFNKTIEYTKKHRKGIIIRIVIITVLVLFCRFQNNHLVTTEYKISSSELPDEFVGYKIVQLSDVHNDQFGLHNKSLINKVKKLEPDIIVITGDLIDDTFTNVNRSIDLCQELVKISPVYYVTGNHEYMVEDNQREELFAGLDRVGVFRLNDEYVPLEKGKGIIYLAGYDENSIGRQVIEDTLKPLKADDYVISLAHEPEIIDRVYSHEKNDLVFTGHAHGGQFILPGVGGVVAPGQGFFPEYYEGVHESGNTKMVISRGLGNSIIPVRLFNYPEIVLVTLKNE